MRNMMPPVQSQEGSQHIPPVRVAPPISTPIAPSLPPSIAEHIAQPDTPATPQQHTDLLRALILLVLALLATGIIIATILVIFMPDNTHTSAPSGYTAASSQRPIDPTTIASPIATIAPALPTLPLAGSFTVTTGAQEAPSQIDLQQFGDQLTGTLRTTTCGAQAHPTLKTAIVTAQIMDTATVRITVSDTTTTTTTFYGITIDPQTHMITLTWHDTNGQIRYQRWTPALPGQLDTAAAAWCQNPQG